MTYEQQFITEIENYRFLVEDMEGYLGQLNHWRDSLTLALGAAPPPITGLKAGSELDEQVRALQRQVADCMTEWSHAWATRQPMQDLSASFGDRAIFLVFGKVNAGKSSFCNFLVERMAAQGKPFQYFYIDHGKTVDTAERFQEGVTETTARIQGVVLGDNLVLLDTPGLHSVTPENGDLTKRYTDSADAVLWLSSSNSPGQVLELDSLDQELRGGKPLVPVITKSDTYEEDEVDGEIVKVLQNKTRANRLEQEQDVKARAQEKLRGSGLDSGLLRDPVSVSAHVGRAHAQQADGLAQAGFEHLYQALLQLAQQALRYKRAKAGRIMVNHLERNVLGSLREHVLPQLDTLQAASQDALAVLDHELPGMTSGSMSAVLGQLPGILERHKNRRDVAGAYRNLSSCMAEAVDHEMKRALRDYAVTMTNALARLQPDADMRFEDEEIEVHVQTGKAKKATTRVFFATVGAAAGSFIPGAGTYAGGALGGAVGDFIGEKAGSYFESDEVQRRTVGVSYDRLLDLFESDVRKTLPGMLAHAVEQCRASIRQIMHEVARLEGIVRRHEQSLIKLKEEIPS